MKKFLTIALLAVTLTGAAYGVANFAGSRTVEANACGKYCE
jgi:hypothetical protein